MTDIDQFGTTDAQTSNFSTKKKLIIVGVAATVVLTLAGAGAWHGWKQVRPDTGVAVCKAMAADKKVGGKDDTKLTKKEYQELRSAFEESRDEELRRHGTAFVDAVWQVTNLKDGEEMGALVFIGALTSSYAGLAGACQKHDVTVPSLGDK